MSLNPERRSAIGKQPGESPSFEATFRELQQIVSQLEDGGLELEHAVRLFERGSQLVQLCERIVDEAELRITRLAAESPSPLSDSPVTP